MILNLPELVTLNEYINAERRNKYIGAKIKKTMTDLVATECYSQKILHLDKIKEIIFIWGHKDMRKDFDNVEFSQKWIRDGMVKAGVVDNDGWKNFPPQTLHKHIVVKDNPGVQVIFS